MLKLFMLKIFK